MKLKESSKPIPDNNQNHGKHSGKILVIFIFFAIVLAGGICGIIIGYIKKDIQDANSKADQLEQEFYHKQELRKQDELDRMEREYADLCSEYNASVETYNGLAALINTFVEKVSDYNIPNLPQQIVSKDENNQDFAAYYEIEQDLSKITQEVCDLQKGVSQLQTQYTAVCQLAYDSVISDYNILAKAYNELTADTSIDFIEGLRSSIILKRHQTILIEEGKYTEDDLLADIGNIVNDTNHLVADYLIVSQITAPSEQWIIERLNTVKSLKGKQAVKKGNDPNGLLGKNGGYNCCVYFTVKSIDADSIPGADIVAKGTDAGGAIEVYPTLDAAKNRCAYLSQYDGTLLYSGSYVLVGTMVVRTSYKLSNQEQVDLTNEIITSFTALE